LLSMNSSKLKYLQFTFLFLIAASVTSYAQNKIQFKQMSFDEAIAEAKKSNKIVFVDVRGIKVPEMNVKVENEIFTVDSVANFFNKNCISIQMNMNTEEGKAFGKKLVMLMYPVYVFHSPDGDQLEFTNSGSILKDPSILMEKARLSLEVARQKRENTRSITFNEDTWKALLAKAKQENKLIFL